MRIRHAVPQLSVRSAGRRPAQPILICAVVLAFCALLPGTATDSAGAADRGRTITLGESNTAAQREELLAYFEAGGGDRISEVSLADTRRAMDGIIDVSAITSAYSSTALTCGPAGSGLEVVTRNIEVVPPALYAMALATAGIDDATLVVAAPNDAPAEGMTALTGVFQTWDLAPCGGASLDSDRQALALQELALAVRIGDGVGGDDGVQDATVLLLAVQRAMIVDPPEGRAGVVEAIEAQERATGVTIPDAERDDVVDLMARLASERIAWGSFDRGWELDRGDDAGRVILRAADHDGSAAVGAASTATATQAPEPTAASTAIAAGVPVSGAADGTGGVTSASTAGSDAGLRLDAFGAGLLALGVLAGLLLLLRHHRRTPPVAIGFVSRARPTVVATGRREVVRRSTGVESTSWYRPRERAGHSDGSAD